MHWHDTVRKMCVDSTWPEMAAAIKSQFPHKTDKQIVDMIRVYLRDKPEYQERKKRTQGNPKYDDKASVTYAGDGTIVSTKFLKLRDGEKLSHRDLLELHGFDAGQWEIVTATNNFWNSQESGGGLQISYQSKLTARPIKGGISLEDIDKHFRALDRQYHKPQTVIYCAGTQIAEVNIADLHVGKLCWHGDTGNDYDYKIARDLFYRLLSEICDELRQKPIEKIVFVWSNDFFNFDNLQQTTTAGTPQDADTRWAKMFNVGCEMLIGGTDMLLDIAPVEMFYTESNHDGITGYAAVKQLQAWFRQDDRVTIDTDARARKYRLYGVTLVGYTHGDKENNRNLSTLMPSEARELWAQAKYCEMHAHHLHSEKMQIEELNGVIVRRISSPVATDAYHYKSGYVGAVRKAQTFLYDKDRGLVHIINTPV